MAIYGNSLSAFCTLVKMPYVVGVQISLSCIWAQSVVADYCRLQLQKVWRHHFALLFPGVSIIPNIQITCWLFHVCFSELIGPTHVFGKIEDDTGWLVVGPPLWKIWKSTGMISNPIYGKIKLMFQTTNQFRCSQFPMFAEGLSFNKTPPAYVPVTGSPPAYKRHISWRIEETLQSWQNHRNGGSDSARTRLFK